MNKLITLLILFLILSCSKYEDGPKLSLLTKESRLVNKWKLDSETKYIEKSQPVTNPDTTYPSISANYIEFEKHNIYYTSNDTGQWDFYDDKKNIIITLNQTKDTFKILKLKNKSLWLVFNSDTGLVEKHFVPYE